MLKIQRERERGREGGRESEAGREEVREGEREGGRERERGREIFNLSVERKFTNLYVLSACRNLYIFK